MKSILPLFYFSPTLCWLDDDDLFLNAIQIKFNKNFKNLTFNQPKDAIEFFSSYQSPLKNFVFKQDVMSSELFGTDHHLPINVELSKISQLIDLPNKSDELALFIVDQNMPEMNGIEVCEKLKALPIKKILLTGETGSDLAIEAFNGGLIDKFISKDTNMGENLKKYIDDLVYQYFYKKTESLISDLELTTPSVVTDPIFVDFFNRWREENKIVEFYLLNKNGSFLVKDSNGKSFCFVVMTHKNLKDFIALTDELFEQEPALLAALQAGEKIPFFGLDKEYWHVKPEAWASCFYPCQMQLGRVPYYWTVVAI